MLLSPHIPIIAVVIGMIAGAITIFVFLSGHRHKVARFLRKILFLRPAKFSQSGRKIFLSVPMSDVEKQPGDTVRVTRGLKATFKQSIDATAFSALDIYHDANTDDGYSVSTTPTMSKDILSELKKSDAYVLVLMEKLSTSSFVEIGMALSQKKTCIIFYKGDVLPWLLRPEGYLTANKYRLNLHPVNCMEDVSKLINTRKCDLFD